MPPKNRRSSSGTNPPSRRGILTRPRRIESPTHARYTSAGQIDMDDLERWLEKARDIQWNYRIIVKRKGELERLK